ncbi:hypothetical protein LUZ61_010656, partial [Rhynchospora tenuis]
DSSADNSQQGRFNLGIIHSKLQIQNLIQESMLVAMALSHTATPTPTRHVSPLNPNASRNSVRTTTASTATASTTCIKTHLSNLDKLLKPSQPKPDQNPTMLNMDVKKPAQNDHEKTPYLLNALNLSSLLPFLQKTAPADEMSPRSLRHLQRLLSDTSRPSPKNSIASRWHMYHGQSNWFGLLDPLDENLRRELVRYGDFVQSAYHAFHSMPSSPASKNRHLILPDRSYRTTRSLYATSSVTLPDWAHRPGTPDWVTQRSSWIGYVAVCDSDREIARMGRRDITIVLRGTATCHEWFENLRASLTPLEEGEETQQGNNTSQVPKVAQGFLSLYKSATEEVKSLSNSVIEEVKRLMELYKGEELSITVVGHSLGAALALLVADEVSACAPHVPPVAVVSFGGPKVGNQAFAERLENRRVKVLRVVNEGDVITRVPGLEIPRIGHVKEGYAHVGVELKVDSKASPCLRSDAGPACSHDLEAYLHLVDGFAGTGQPFRSDAKRSIARLLRHQRTSVKEIYVNRAHQLGFDSTAAAMNRAESFGCAPSPSYR